jgi:hypothetical protein
LSDASADLAGIILTSPNAIGLPAAERHDAPASATRAIVTERWPEIERLLASGRAAEAISAMERLAEQMRRATAHDALLFRDALTQARRILYADIVEVGRVAGEEAFARAALDRCAAWDSDLLTRDL